MLVKVEGLSKKFCKDLKTSLWYGVKDLVSQVSGNKEIETLRPKEFWALKDINFELRRGECLGLIGHNGAGKSTLLKILNGLINPDQGKVTMRGRVGALIELGAGFNPILTGRENIYNNGAVLGFTRKEIDAKVEEIIDFSEVREFIDMPVQNYSSGMKVRLGFAVAAQMEPDILLIDEVLAVGDLGFRLKCFKTIDEILPNTAIIFVSHSMPMVSRICSHIVLMDRGIVKYQGVDVSKGIDLYYGKFDNNHTETLVDDNSVAIEKVELNSGDSSDCKHLEINWGDDLILKLKFKNIALKKIPYINLAIYDKEQRGVAILDFQEVHKEINNQYFRVVLKVENVQLSAGVYSFSLGVTKEFRKHVTLKVNHLCSIKVSHKREIWHPFLLRTTQELEQDD